MTVKKSSLGAMIQTTRKRAGLTQKELADLADVGKTLIFDLEKGHESIHFDKLKRICRVLSIKIHFENPRFSKS